MLSSWLSNAVLGCWCSEGWRGSREVVDRRDALLRHRDLARHGYGEFSMATVQANQLPEDQCQIESGQFGTFIGIYDGHHGPEAAKFIKNNLYPFYIESVSDQGGKVSVDAIRKALNATEQGFESVVSQSWLTKPQLAAVGSCCIVGVIYGKTLYVANIGDSRAVLGSVCKATGAVVPVQLSTEHNASVEAVRQELRLLHPDDPRIVVTKNGVWRVKGIIQVSRSIGDFYLKKQEFNREPLLARFRVAEPLRQPILTAEPTIIVYKLQVQDRFVIFASDGLWEHLSNDDAVELVHRHPRKGVAKRLVIAALHVAAKKREMCYADLKNIERGVRRHFHDDITVYVVFLDRKLMEKKSDDEMVLPGVIDHHSVTLNILASEGLNGSKACASSTHL